MLALRRHTHMGRNRSRSMKLFSINCHHTGTFPAVHSLQHPLVIAFVWGHPLSAHAVRGEIPVPLLLGVHCHRLSAHRILMIKYPLAGFPPLIATSAFLASICPSGPRLVPVYAVLWPQSTQHFTNLWFLSPSRLLTPSLGSFSSFFFLSLPLTLFLS